MLRRLVILAIALLALLTVAELVVRVAGWTQGDAQVEPTLRTLIDGQRLVRDPVLVWRMNPAGPTPLDPLGLPSRALDAHKTDRHLRVALVGGSLVSGFAGSDDDSVAARLERQVQRELPGARVEVAQVAAPFYSSHQSARLLQRCLPALAADLVVICFDASADATPATFASDAETTAALSHPPRLHLQRAWQTWRRSSATATSAKTRVPLDDAKRNLEMMIDAARRAGAEVWVCVAPYGPDSEAKLPAVRDYAQAAAAVAAARTCVFLETDETVRAYRRSLDGLPICGEVGEVHGFWRGDELSRPGAALVAELIGSRMRALPRHVALSQRPAEATLQIQKIEPPSVAALSSAEITVSGTGFDANARLWIGDRRVSAQVVQGGLRAKLPIDLVPGRHAAGVSTPQGFVTGGDLTITAPPLQVSSVADFAGVRLDVRGEATAGAKLRLLTSAVANTTAEPTPAGPFWLRYQAKLARWNHAPFCFENVPLEQVEATAGQDGKFSVILRARPEPGQLSVAVQGVIWLPGDRPRGVVTDLAVHQISK